MSLRFVGRESRRAGRPLMRFWRVVCSTSYDFAEALVLVKWPFWIAPIARAIRPSCYIDWVVFGRGILAKVYNYA